MTVRILRRLKAAEDAESIADHIAKDSLKAAVRFLGNTESTLLELAEPALELVQRGWSVGREGERFLGGCEPVSLSLVKHRQT